MTLPAVSPNGAVVGLQLVSELEVQGAISETGLRLERLDLDYDQCEALAFLFGRMKRITSWLIGDLIAYSERKFGQIAPQIGEATGLAPQSLMNLASVSRRVAPERRRASLPHGVHAEIASLEPAEQERWLSEAEKGDWSRSDLRAHMRDEEDGCTHEWVCAKCGEVK